MIIFNRSHRAFIIVFWISFTLNSIVAGQGTHNISFSEKLRLAKSHIANAKPKEALELMLPVLNVKEALITEDSIQLYSTIGQCYYQMQQYTDAISYYKKANDMASGNDTLTSSFNYQIGLSFYRKSDYQNATKYMIEARNLYRKLYGTNDRNYTASLNTLGFLYNIQAKYSEAEKTFQEARQISLRLNGGEDLQYSRIINNLANVYCNLNRFESADELYKTSLRIKEKISGRNSKDYANTLYNLADFYSHLGRYDKAKSTIQEGIDIFKNLNETNHPDYLKFFDYLAILTDNTDQEEEAEKLFKEALGRRDSLKLTDRDDYALNLMNLGGLYVEQKKYKEAFPYIEKAVALISSIYGKSHPTYAKVLISLASIQSKQNDHKNALLNYREAIQIIQKTLGRDHIESFNAQFTYAKYIRTQGNKEEAISIYKKIDPIPRLYLKRASRFLSEKELSEKVQEYKSYIHELYSFLREYPEEEELASLAYNMSIYYRGFILNSMQRIRLNMLKAQKVSDSRDEIISLHRQLENELNRPITERGNTREIELMISEKESEIASKIGSFSDEERLVTWEDVRLSLGEKETALEFILFPDSKAGDSLIYGALLLNSDLLSPIYIDICSESDLIKLLRTNPNRTSDYIAMLYNFSNRGASVITDNGKNLMELIWRPLQDVIRGTKRLFIVPDGLLNRVAFAAIPTSLENVISDSIHLIYLSSTKQVIPNDLRIMAYSGNHALVVGGVLYDSEPVEMVASRTGTSTDQKKIQWQYLPWAEKESKEVITNLKKANFSVSYFAGNNATENRLLDSLEKSEDYRLIHFATHGYFANSTEHDQKGSSNFYGGGMMNSAIVLSGANQARNALTDNERNDGLLTAYAISKLNLSKTELVVLSACETALGDIQEVEGVYGLQRAFKLAGVNQLIMSLWQIPDRETKDFMVSFYKNWLTDRVSIREAFYKTQMEFRERFVNPYQWAGFVLLE
jgi:tetratricopeptide (TPR) repeat protein